MSLPSQAKFFGSPAISFRNDPTLFPKETLDFSFFFGGRILRKKGHLFQTAAPPSSEGRKEPDRPLDQGVVDEEGKWGFVPDLPENNASTLEFWHGIPLQRSFFQKVSRNF
jgi:hypothetical protein